MLGNLDVHVALRAAGVDGEAVGAVAHGELDPVRGEVDVGEDLLEVLRVEYHLGRHHGLRAKMSTRSFSRFDGRKKICF